MPVIASRVRKGYWEKSGYKLHRDNNLWHSENGFIEVPDNLKWKLAKILHAMVQKMQKSSIMPPQPQNSLPGRIMKSGRIRIEPL